MSETETWRVLDEFPDYDVSDQGRVCSRAKYRGDVGPRIMTGTADADGYLQVHVRSVAGSSRVMRTHTLVMLAFAGPRPEGYVIRHLDGNATNNRLDNLSWGTPSQNSLDQVTHGTHPFASRTHCKHGHEYSPDNTAIYLSTAGKPFRQCITCNRARRQRQRPARAAAA